MNLREARQVVDSIDTIDIEHGRQYQTPDGATVIVLAKPAGAFVIKDGRPLWCPAVDKTRVLLFGVGVGLLATALSGVAMVRRPPWPDLHGTVTFDR